MRFQSRLHGQGFFAIHLLFWAQICWLPCLTACRRRNNTSQHPSPRQELSMALWEFRWCVAPSKQIFWSEEHMPSSASLETSLATICLQSPCPKALYMSLSWNETTTRATGFAAVCRETEGLGASECSAACAQSMLASRTEGFCSFGDFHSAVWAAERHNLSGAEMHAKACHMLGSTALARRPWGDACSLAHRPAGRLPVLFNLPAVHR